MGQADHLQAYQFRPGESGRNRTPKWLNALRREIGSGEELWLTLIEIASGRGVMQREPSGKPRIGDDGEHCIVYPTVTDVRSAIEALADRCFGKPLAAIAIKDLTDASDAVVRNVMMPKEQAEQLRALAHAAILHDPGAEPTTIEVTPERVALTPSSVVTPSSVTEEHDHAEEEHDRDA